MLTFSLIKIELIENKLYCTFFFKNYYSLRIIIEKLTTEILIILLHLSYLLNKHLIYLLLQNNLKLKITITEFV